MPLRTSLELAGASDIKWVQEKGEIVFKFNEDEFALYIDKPEVQINGKPEFFSLKTKIENGSAYIPIDFFIEYLSMDPKSDLYKKIYSLADSKIYEKFVNEKKLRQSIVNTALKYVGIPYKWGGASPSGFDSSGLIWYTFKKNGITLPRVSFDIYKTGKPISKAELLPGDLVFFQGYKKGPSHATIFAGNGKFVHSPSTGKTVSVSRLLSDRYYWGPRFYSALRLINAN